MRRLSEKAVTEHISATAFLLSLSIIFDEQDDARMEKMIWILAAATIGAT